LVLFHLANVRIITFASEQFSMRNIYFTPGPSALYFTVEQHLKYAINNGIASISHRSKQFENIFCEAEKNLNQLLNLPDNYQMVFTGSASEIWEKISDGFIENRSLHIVNGAFSKKFASVVSNLGKQADIIEAPWGEVPDYSSINSKPYDVIGITHNETSTGVKTPLESIYSLKQSHPEALLTIDAVSSLPVVDFDYNKVDSVYASVQKAFGLPAGLGIWLLKEKAIEKARKMKERGLLRNSFHNILQLVEQAKKYQTPSTPNILGIYLFSQVTKDMINRGIQQIRNDNIYKAAILYNMLDQHDILKPFVKDNKLRSETIIVIDSGNRTEDLIKFVANHKMEIGDGYGAMKGKQVRIANFPTHSKEQFEMLVDIVEKFE